MFQLKDKARQDAEAEGTTPLQSFAAFKRSFWKVEKNLDHEIRALVAETSARARGQQQKQQYEKRCDTCCGLIIDGLYVWTGVCSHVACASCARLSSNRETCPECEVNPGRRVYGRYVKVYLEVGRQGQR